MRPAIEIDGLYKSFNGVPALRGVSLKIAKGEMVALLGPSGSGKSTLLRHISGLMKADKAPGPSRVIVNGKRVQEKGKIYRGIRHIRSEVGFVFQHFNLVGRLSVITNVLAGKMSNISFWRTLPRIYTTRERLEALDALRRVGIAEHAFKRATDISGGQQQRAAIARTLVQGAKTILADEPIASLDPASSHVVMQKLQHINQHDDVTVVVSLHQIDFALGYCDRIVALRDGQVYYDGPREECTREVLVEIYGAGANIPEISIPQSMKESKYIPKQTFEPELAQDVLDAAKHEVNKPSKALI